MSLLQIEVDGTESVGTALISADGAVWVPVEPHWYDLATWIWWFLCPSDAKARVMITTNYGKSIRTRAIRIAKRHARVRGTVR